MPDLLALVLTLSIYALSIGAIIWLLTTLLQMSRTLRNITDRLDEIERTLFQRDKG